MEPPAGLMKPNPPVTHLFTPWHAGTPDDFPVVGRRRRQTRGIRHLQPVENVGEVHPDREAHPLFESEYPADAERFGRPALIAIVIVVRSRRAPLPIGGIDPGGLIQDQVFGGIDAVTVQVLQEQRLAGIAVIEGTRTAAEQQTCSGYWWKSAPESAFRWRMSSRLPNAQSRTARETILLPCGAGTR